MYVINLLFVPLIIYLKYINVPNEMRHIIYSFILLIDTGTSGLAHSEAVLNRVLLKRTDTKKINTLKVAH